ncbi:MAG: flavodoxin-dependent (E)-4-hydroxy-3-methylbut-2-enyl-diphosphate synthase, partial [Candidatus Acidiferrales bacterium]
QVPYPFHLGITEAGAAFAGTIKSSVGLGMLLAEGLGDTIRVSLAADPCEEVRVAYEILKSLDIRARGINVIACPTCGRLEVDLFKIVDEIERQTSHIKEPLNVAVMGCAVNGPGEARTAHLGVACGRGNGVIYRDGVSVRRVPEEQIVDELVKEIESYVAQMQAPVVTAGEPTDD